MVRLAWLLLAAFAAQAASAQGFEWSAFVGVDHSDNIRRTPVDAESETVAQAGVSFDIDSERTRVKSALSGNVRALEYLDSAFDSEVLAGVDAKLDFIAIPDRFLWIVEDHFGQVANDPRATDTPDNRQNINYFSTGPDFIVPLGDRLNLNLQGRLEEVSYENSEDDSSRYEATLGLVNRLSEASSISFNASTEHVEYDSLDDEGYDVHEGYLGYEVAGARTSLSANLGYTSLENQGESHSGVLARVSVSRKVGVRSLLALQVGREFSDTADVFQMGRSFRSALTETSDAAALNDPFQADYLSLSWTTDARRAAIRFFATVRDESHEVQTALDRKLLSAGLDLSRQISARLNANLRGTYSRDEFEISAVDRKESSIGVGLGWLHTSTLNIRFDLLRIEGSGPSGDTRSYEENRGFVTLTYGRRRN